MIKRAGQRVTRREFSVIAGGAAAALALGTACHAHEPQGAAGARVTARPRRGVKTSASGSRALGLDAGRDGLLQMPRTQPAGPLPLLVLLHGAGGSGAGIVRRLGSFADEAGLIVLAPDARASTWDAIRGNPGPDVSFLNRALERVFETAAVDPARITVGGFSDGATYVLTLGLLNGSLFRRVLAFSTGFFAGGALEGKPRFFISHGVADTVLPIDRCSRVIVPALQKQGYDDTFREFDGGHDIPGASATEGMRWAAAP